MSEHVVLDDEVVELPGSDVVPVVPAAPPSLFHTDDPAEILQKAKAVADALAPVIRNAGLVAKIGDKEYLQVEAWQTCGQQVGVTPVVTATHRLTDPDGWEARCEARTLDGRTIGAADSMCLRSEARWKDSEDFEIRSMAQTRAMSRALASVLRFIPTLAGMAGTPAEEMDRVKAQGAGGGPKGRGFASEKQRQFFERLLGEAGFNAEGITEVCDFARSTMSGGRDQGISQAIDGLKDEATRTEFADRLSKAAKEFAAKLADDVNGTAAPEPSEGEDEERFPF